MSLPFTTVAVLLLLLPGVLFFLGLGSPERFSRDAARQGPVAQVALAVLVALVLHAAALAGLGAFCGATAWLPCPRPSLAIALLGEGGTGDPARLALASASLDRFWPQVAVYLLATSLAGMLLGLLAGTAIDHGWPGTRRIAGYIWGYGWAYDLYVATRSGFPTAYVLTRIRHEEQVLMYRGFLVDFRVDPEGQIGFIALQAATRAYLVLEPGSARTSDPASWRRIGATHGAAALEAAELESVFVIRGEEIANVVFDFIPQRIRPGLATRLLRGRR